MPNAHYCDYCGERIRDRHQLTHPDWPEAIMVCAACTTKLTGTDCQKLEGCFRAHNAAKSPSDN